MPNRIDRAPAGVPDPRRSEKRRRNILPALLCAACASWACSCSNVVEYDYENVALHTRHWHADEFLNVEIGGPLPPYKENPALLVKMSDGTVLNLATATAGEIQGKCSSIQDWSGNACSDFSTRRRPPDGTRWPAGTIRMQDDSRQFFVRSNRIIAVRIHWDGHPGPKPEVGNPATGEMHAFPLSGKTVVALFGKPAEVVHHNWE